MDEWAFSPRWARTAMVAYLRGRDTIDYWQAEDQAERMKREQKSG